MRLGLIHKPCVPCSWLVLVFVPGGTSTFREFSKRQNDTPKDWTTELAWPTIIISGAELDFLDPRADRLNPLNLYVHNRLFFFCLSFCSFLTPSIEFFIPFNQHGHERVVGNPFGEVRMLPNVWRRDPSTARSWRNFHVSRILETSK